VHVHHTEPERLTGLLSLDDVDRLLTSTAIRTPAVRLARDGQVLSASGYTRPATLAGQQLTGLVDARKALDEFERGATVVLQGLHRYWEPVTTLVADLELELGHPCQANAYLTPPSSRGFALHSDSHDVFVFQTHGTKEWELHDAGGVRSLVLAPGTSVYLPTGTPHAARAQDSVSLHVTVGINRVTWREVLDRALHDAVDRVSEGPLPAGYIAEPSRLTEDLGTRLRAVASALLDTDPAEVVSQETRRFLSTRPSRLRGGLRDRVALPEVSDETVLARRPGHPCVLRPDGDRVRVLLGYRELVVPGHLREALERIRDVTSLRPAELGDLLDGQSRLVLCRRLVREGLLEVTG
jgi:mannose-6-phosphate isomerase-like protein (cupin superfamily)